MRTVVVAKKLFTKSRKGEKNYTSMKQSQLTKEKAGLWGKRSHPSQKQPFLGQKKGARNGEWGERVKEVGLYITWKSSQEYRAKGKSKESGVSLKGSRKIRSKPGVRSLSGKSCRSGGKGG